MQIAKLNLVQSLLFLALATSGVASAQELCAQALKLDPTVRFLNLETQRPEFQTRLAGAKTVPFEVEAGRLLFTQLFPPAQDENPFILSLPGSNRALLTSENEMRALAIAGFGLASFNFSPQILSLAGTPKDIKPYFSQHTMSLADFATEADRLAQALKGMGAKRVVPVTLSYSGLVSPLLKGYDLIVDVSPMTAWSATPAVAQGASVRSLLDVGAMFNPFFGQALKNAALESGYRTFWGSQVDRLSAQFKLDKDRRSQFVDGMLSLTKAADGQEWDLEQLDPKTKRVFLLGIEESPSLLQHQLLTAQKMMEKGLPINLVLMLHAGHVLPDDQPLAFSKIVQAAVAGQGFFAGNHGVMVVNPISGEVKRHEGAEAIPFIQTLIAASEKDAAK